MLYTAQYRYPGKDRLDITIKGNKPEGKLYAPTWKMVQDYKNNIITNDQYTVLYYNLLIERWKTNSIDMLTLVDRINKEDVTVVCFCPAGKFCHRYLLIKFLIHNWKIEYGGERLKQ